MGRRSLYLTKTRYVDGLACRKKLWLEFNAPGRLPKANETGQFQMDEGQRVGELARRRFPGATLIGERQAEENDRRSRKLLGERIPLLEAGFVHPDRSSFARADVLLPVGENEWDIVEVKSAGSVKEEFLHDLAFQYYCYSGAGLKIRKCFLLHVDTTYVRKGEVDPFGLFDQEDITERVAELSPTVQSNVSALLESALSKDCPEFGKGESFHDDDDGIHDDDAVWTEHPGADIRNLYRGGKRSLSFLESGVFRIRDIPKSFVLKGQQAIQRDSHTTGQIHVDSDKIASFLRQLEYPLHFLDFETTYGTAIPLFDGTSPYQPIPFQYSVHVVNEPGQVPIAHSFLSTESDDPRRALVASLRRDIGPNGHVVVYNQGFEKRILNDLGRFLPDSAKWVSNVTARIVDLLVPFRNFDYYNPQQRGKASIKAVLPALTGRSYDHLEIAEGAEASLAFLRAAFPSLFGESPTRKDIEQTRARLVRYCGQDTEGMAWIVEELARIARPSNA